MNNLVRWNFVYGVATAFFVAFLTFLVAMPAEARTKTIVPKNDLVTLIKEIQKLQNQIDQRKQFNLTGPATITERPEYFAANLAENSVKILVGDDTSNISINTDGGVSQILIVSKCSELNGVLQLGQNKKCVEKTWATNYTEKDGIRNFVIPITYLTSDIEEKLSFAIYACRYNGCIFERNISVQYKDQLAFADTVRVYDRYEWTYEWDEKTYHVQEVLLSFPINDIKRVKLLVRCDVSGLYINTEDEERATCNNRREYTNPEFRKITTDDQGNTYNLKVESVTKDIQKENVGAVAMTFTFINKQNRVIYELTHRPVQLDVEEENEDENEDEIDS